MMSVTRVFLEVAVIIHCVDETLFSFDVLVYFVYAMEILMYDHTHNSNNNRERRWGGGGGL